MTYKVTVFLIFASVVCFSQADLAKHINALMSQIKSQAVITVDRSKISSNITPKEATVLLSPFFTDSLASIRYEALSIHTQAAIRSKNKIEIKKAIHAIVSYGVIGGSINNQIIELLKQYKRENFEMEELELINTTLQSQENNIGILAKIYAFAGEQLANKGIRLLLTKPHLTKADKKDVKLALVRCGDEQLAAKMNETLKQQVINDDFIYFATPDVIYTKNKMLYTHLLNAILSNDKKCTTANNDDNTLILCAYRLIEIVALQIHDFPTTTNEKNVLNANNENITLVEIRDWINKHKETFSIVSDVY